MSLQLVTKSSEVKLMEFTHDVEDASSWKAVHFHLGSLIEQYQSEYQFKIALNLAYDLLRDYEGRVFILNDNGIIALCNHLEENTLNKLIFQLRYLYMDDPLSYTDDGQENPAFCDIYHLDSQWQAFTNMASKKMASSVRGPAAVAAPMVPPRAAAAAAETRVPMQPRMTSEMRLSGNSLSQIEHDLNRADYSSAWRRQSVCAVPPNANARRVFDEIYIHIAQLRRVLSNDIDFFSNRWLFKYVTEILDQRMIQMIQNDPSEFIDPPISLNLNVETLLSSWFTDLDSVIPDASKVAVIIEVPVLDAFADINAFMIARDEVQKMGYRLCLDGLNEESFMQINRSKLGADLVKLQWNADVQSDLKKSRSKKLAEAVQLAGSNRVILCRCDNKQAIEYGQAMGISLFQGRYIDSLVNPDSKIVN